MRTRHDVTDEYCNPQSIYECRCDERLKAKTEGSTRLTYTGLCGGLGHLKPSDRDEFKRSYSHSIYVEVNTECCSLGEDVPDLRLDL